MRPTTAQAIEFLSRELPARLEAAGYDAEAVAKNPMGAQCAGQVIRGQWTIEEFLECVEKLAIMNPALRKQRTTIETVSVTSNRIGGPS